MKRMAFITACLVLFSAVAASIAYAVDYDIIYVRAPRYGDTTSDTLWPEVKIPVQFEPGSDLVLWDHTDSSETVLVDTTDGAVLDPKMSFDGLYVYYSYCPDVTDLDVTTDSPKDGCDIWKMKLSDQSTTKLTDQTFTPPKGAAVWCDDMVAGTNQTDCTYTGYGVFNVGPQPLPGGKLMYTSNRDAYIPNKAFTFPALQLYVLDEATGYIERVGFLNVGSALHPTILTDGTVMFTSYESQGVRNRRLWGLWKIWPDGRKWEPIASAFFNPLSVHFQTQMSTGKVVANIYYNQNNNGFGSLFIMDSSPTFGDGDASNNTAVPWGCLQGAGSPTATRSHPFQPSGFDSITDFADPDDHGSCWDANDDYMGKYNHPSAAPDNHLLAVWSGRTPANQLPRPSATPYVDGAIVEIDADTSITDPSQHTVLIDSTSYNEQQPIPVLSYNDIYGVSAPTELSWLTVDSKLSPGEPFGLVGTSSIIHRDTDSENSGSNWEWQGANTVAGYSDSDIYGIRILAMEPTEHMSKKKGTASSWALNKESYFNNITESGNSAERLRIVGEFAVRHYDTQNPPQPILDSNGDQDTSFLAKIPADMPFTFQTIDNKGRVLNMAQTWHQVRPGENRHDCGGCHAHSKTPLSFTGTEADDSGYTPHDLTTTTPLITAAGGTTSVGSTVVDYEWTIHIEPLLNSSTHYASKTYAEVVADLPGSFDFKGSTLESTLETEGDLTADQIMDVARWVALGMPIDTGGGWFVDAVPPTLHLKVDGSTLYVGAFDYYSGMASTNPVVIKIDSTDETSNFTFDSAKSRYSKSICDHLGETVEAVATDSDGNTVTRKMDLPSSGSSCVPTPMSWYPFDTDANDDVGSQHFTENGTVSYTSSGGGSVDEAAFLNTGYLNGASFTDVKAVSFWFNTGSSQTAFERMFWWGSGASSDRLSLRVNNFGAIRVFYGGSQIGSDISGGVPSTGTWYHYVVQHDGSNVKVYRDKTEIFSSAQTLITGTFDFGVGSSPQPIGGYVDDLHVFSQTLTSDQIQALYDRNN